MATGNGVRLRTESLTRPEWVGGGLSVVLGVVYLVLGVGGLPGAFGITFVLAGLGYLGATALVVIGYRRRLVYLTGIGYNLLLVVLYAVINGVDPADLASLGGGVKLLQIAFAGLLVALVRSE